MRIPATSTKHRRREIAVRVFLAGLGRLAYRWVQNQNLRERLAPRQGCASCPFAWQELSEFFRSRFTTSRIARRNLDAERPGSSMMGMSQAISHCHALPMFVISTA
jgi:hypothetical protein